MRNPNIEILRVFLMLSIVFDHCAAQGYFADNLFAYGLATATTYSVDTFVFISGWYAIRFSLKKMLRFLVLGGFCSFLLLLASKPALGHWQYSFRLGWFGNAYLGLMILAPFVNAGVEKLSRKELLTVWGACAALMVGMWLPFREFGINIVPTGWGPQTVGNMLFVYLTGRVASTSDWVRSRSLRFWCGATVLSWLMMLTMVCGVHFLRVRGCVSEAFLNVDGSSYASPLIVICATSLFMTFTKVRFPQFLGRVCLYLGPSMFSVYLLHAGCHKVVAATLISRFEATLNSVLIPGPIGIVLNLVITAVVVFVVCVGIDLLRRTSVALLLRGLGK